jgi:hypothetical protein
VRVTVQRNKMHDPRYSANSWSDGHPAGPQGITFSYCGGNHVLRWNEITGGSKHLNDGMGGEDNFSTTGFPNRDSDIYGNSIQNTWDDAIESEGGNANVRIWGNYLNNTATGVATTATAIGPVYIFRNVFNRNKFFEKTAVRRRRSPAVLQVRLGFEPGRWPALHLPQHDAARRRSRAAPTAWAVAPASAARAARSSSTTPSR